MSKTFLTKLMCFVFALCFVFVACSDKELPTGANVSDNLLSRSYEAVSDNQEKFSNMNFDKLSVSANAEIIVGDAFYDLLSKYSDAPAAGNMIKQLGVNSVKLHADVDRSGDAFLVNVDGKVNGTEILSGNGILDLDDEEMYLNIPAVSDQTVKVDVSNALDDEFEEAFEFFGAYFDRMKKFDEDVSKIITDEELVAILGDYFDCGLKELGAPETGSKSISAAKVTQKVDYKKYTVDEEGAVGFAEAVVTKLHNDDNLRDKFIKLYPVLVEFVEETYGFEYEMNYGSLPSAEEIYDEEFLPLVEEALEELEDYDFSGSDEEVYFEQYFVNGNFVGFSLIVPEGGTISFYSVESGNDVAVTFVVADEDNSEKFDCTLAGKVYNGVFNGDIKVSGSTYTYDYDYETYDVIPTREEYNFSIGIENVDLNKMEKGIINGTVVIDLESFEGFDADEVPGGLVVKVSFETDGYFNGKYSLGLECDEGLILVYNFDYKISDDAKDIKMPANAVSPENWETKDEEEILGYFIDRLKKAGVNESILAMAESYL